MWKTIKEWLAIGRSFVPEYGELLKLGLRPVIMNGEFILRKESDCYSLHLHQGVEPHNPLFGHLIDFDIDEAVLVVELLIDSYKEETLLKIMERFDYAYHRKNFLFCMNKKMRIHDRQTAEAVEWVVDLLKEKN